MKNFEKDDTEVEISCRACGTRFKKRADEGVSICYECYKNRPALIVELLADLRTRYGSFEFAEHISKTKQDVFANWFKDASDKIYAIGYQSGMEDKISEKPLE